jgi:hypothetical protein
MVCNPGFGQVFTAYWLRKQRVAAAIPLSLVLGLQCFGLHAELLFRGVEQANGLQTLSSLRKYSNPSDTAYARDSARGAVTPPEEVRVLLSGRITHADVDSATVMESLIKSGRQKIAGNTVWLASNGGDIDAAMELGRRLRRLGVFTLIGKDDQCFSACVFAFMGGERRSVAGRLGIHRPYFPFTDGTPDRPARFRFLQQTLKAYIEEMDFPDSLYEAVMLVPPESLQILTAAELKRFYLEGISPSTEDMVDAAAARRLNLSMFEYLQRKAKAPPCVFPDSGQGGCERRAPEAVTKGGATEFPGNMQPGETAAAGRADSIPSGRLIRLRKPSETNPRGPT